MFLLNIYYNIKSKDMILKRVLIFFRHGARYPQDGNIKDFISGMLLGISIAEMLVGSYCVGRSLYKH